jgi:NAD(P)-dependent dehydrogenase (short-subunit alcohol dehydrogenase family)
MYMRRSEAEPRAEELAMDLHLSGKVAVVTGASKGIGLAVTRALTALANFLKSLSKEVGLRGIRVNSVSPGPVAPALWLGDDGAAATIARASGPTSSSTAA